MVLHLSMLQNIEVKRKTEINKQSATVSFELLARRIKKSEFFIGAFFLALVFISNGITFWIAITELVSD
jgi:hypothetical protein